ncbi:tyrosine-protein kinase family protein [Microvirga guangxiensis]|uniref:Chromosome partitioning ATPase, Mrp family, contains Fe-S cluster n=1 Tax=Microvirga guangxiensis TaxID=549386 RepID=A0A1G5H0D2_9HYPH|nr:tyrosine-protein kinase family protein [Microvirga guangxiensis]SCY57194.1 Chromosome partitioning ATPase, Mrp family, contains Fe-S cluster [Microvirga guangxiensis]
MRYSSIPLSLRRACRDILATVQPGPSGVVLGIMSTLPREGVSTITIGLSKVLGDTQQVLLVDASAGLPIAELINAEPRPLVISELLHPHYVNVRDWITSDPERNFDLLTLHPDQLSAPSWEGNWAALKELLTQKYDLILVDLGSLQKQLSPSWSGGVDYMYMVVDMSLTTVDALVRSRKELDVLRLPISGVILNRRTFSTPAFLAGDRL